MDQSISTYRHAHALINTHTHAYNTIEPYEVHQIVEATCRQALADLNVFRSFKELQLTNVTWDDRTGVAKFFNTLLKCPNLIHLNLNNFHNMIYDDNVDTIPPLPITKLSIEECTMGVITYVMPLILRPHAVVSLHLTNVGLLPMKAFSMLVQALRTNETSLEELCLRRIDIARGRFSSLMHALETNTTVKALELQGDSSCFNWREVYRLLCKNRTLIVVKIGDTNRFRLNRSYETCRSLPYLKSVIQAIASYHPTLVHFSSLGDPYTTRNWIPFNVYTIRYTNNIRKAEPFTSLLLN